jgi:hypothetical protein
MTVWYADDRLAEIFARETDWIQHSTVCSPGIALGDDSGTSVESHFVLPAFIQGC